MNTGTISLAADSTTVTGTGTAFTSELKAGDFIFTTVDGINYTLGVGSVTSDTELTLTVAFNGATTSGMSFDIITRQAMVGITAQLAADTARAIRGLNYDKQNWQQILSGSGTVSVTLPDGSKYSGPAWPDITSSLSSINTSLAEKADSSDLDAYAKTTDLDIYAKTASLGGSASLGVGTSSGTVAAGDDSRFGTVDGKSGGTISSDIYVTGNAEAVVTYGDTSTNGNNLYSGEVGAYFNGWGATSNRPGAGMYMNAWNEVGGDMNGNITLISSWTGSQTWSFNTSGNATSPGSWVNNSDERLKKNITKIDSPLSKMTNLRGVSWERLDGMSPGLGFIAQSVQRDFPNNVFTGSSRKLLDGTIVKNVLSPDTSGVSAALHHEAILSLMSIMKKGLTLIAAQTSDATTKTSLTDLAALIPDESTYATQ